METALLIKFALAFVFVIGLMLLLSFALKRAGLAGPVMTGGAKRRLRIVEALPLDHRRRLVIVRRDDREHLLVLGPSGETVVEQGIPVQEAKVIELAATGEKKNVQI
jgi:flagellar protein FliO/FliZ